MSTFVHQTGDYTKIPMSVDPMRQRLTGTTHHGNMDFDMPYMSEIAPNLYQGGCSNGMVLPDNIKHMVSLYKWQEYKVLHELETKLTITMFDSHDQTYEKIDAIADLVNACRQDGPVLVHCQAGLNRSGLVVATALIKSGMTADEAIALIQEKRSPAALCNTSFVKHLRSIG